MKKTFFTVIIIVLIASIPLFLSSKRKNSKKNYKDSFVIATDMPIGYVNPLTRVGMSSVAVNFVYSRLFTYGTDEELHPSLAKSYQWENEGKELRIILDKIDAEDVKKTFEYFKAQDDLLIDLFLENYESTEIVSDREIIIHLKKFDRFFLEMSSKMPMIAFSKEDWTTGEFRVLENSEQHIILKRKVPSEHLVNHIKIYYLANVQEAFQNLLENKVDLIWYAQRIEDKSFNDHPNIYSFPDKDKGLIALIEGEKTVNWNEIRPFIEANYLKEIYGASFDSPAESLLHPQSKWYIKDFSSSLLKNSKLKLESKNINKNYQLNYLDSVGRGKQLAHYLKNKIEEYSSEINIKIIEHNRAEKIKKVSEHQSLWSDGFENLFIFALTGESAIISHYLYFKDPGDKPLILNYKNPTVDYYLDQARYTQDFKEARYALNRAVEEIKADPPGLFLFWMRMPLVMRKACRLSTELGPRYFFQALDEIECIEEESSETEI